MHVKANDNESVGIISCTEMAQFVQSKLDCKVNFSLILLNNIALMRPPL